MNLFVARVERSGVRESRITRYPLHPGYFAVNPPSMTNSAPVTKADSPDSK
jgi:hypothetical protein